MEFPLSTATLCCCVKQVSVGCIRALCEPSTPSSTVLRERLRDVVGVAVSMEGSGGVQLWTSARTRSGASCSLPELLRLLLSVTSPPSSVKEASRAKLSSKWIAPPATPSGITSSQAFYTSASFLSELSVRSPQKLFIFII